MVLPRIPLNALGKGPDDLRAFWGADFPWRWQLIIAAAEPVNIEEKYTTLAVRLLRREVDTFPKPDEKAFEKTRERLIKFAASIQDDALAFSDVQQIAVKALQIAKPVFRAAVKAQADIAKEEAAKRDADQALADLGANGSNPLYFDGSAYWRREADLAFGRLCREDARLHLNKAGLSKVGDPAPCDAALHSLQVSNRVDYAGPLCGRPAGLHLENGMRVLATRGPFWIEGKPGECPTIVALVANLFGHAAGDEHDVFIGSIGGVIAAGRAFPDARHHGAVGGGVQHPGFHFRVARRHHPTIQRGGGGGSGGGIGQAGHGLHGRSGGRGSPRRRAGG